MRFACLSGGVLVVAALAACHSLMPLSQRSGEPTAEASPMADGGGLDVTTKVETGLGDQTVSPCDDPGWWNAAWKRRRKLSFDNSAQKNDLIGFPVAVRIDHAQYSASDFLPGGIDVRFVWSGKVLPHEIESWNPEGVVWVKVPTISAGSSTDHIWLYFANPAASPAYANVWDASFVGVWHLQSDPGPGVNDSSQHANHASNSGLTANDCKAGRFGRGLAFNGASYLRIPSTDTDELAITQPALTLEGWGRLQPSGRNYYTIVSRMLGTEWWDAFTLVARDNNPPGPPDLDLRFQTYPESVKSTKPFLTETWHHLAGVRDGKQMQVYIDGQQVGSITAAGGAIGTDKRDVLIGANENYTSVNEHWEGMIDEVRISTVARSDSWIAATYLNGVGKLVVQGPVQSCH